MFVGSQVCYVVGVGFMQHIGRSSMMHGARPRTWWNERRMPPKKGIPRDLSTRRRLRACAAHAALETSNTTSPTANSATPLSLWSLRNSRTVMRALWDEAVQPGDVCIDATCGRGSDTLYLARRAGKGGIVHAFDIQQGAVDETKRRFAQAVARGDGSVYAELNAVCRSHVDLSGLARVGAGTVSAVVYNLGWYPGEGADKRVITKASTTLESLEAVLPFVRFGGVITVMAYMGHDGGLAEAQAVEEWAAELDKGEWSISLIAYPNRGKAPRLISFERIGKT